MLGMLKMSVGQAIEGLLMVAFAVFPGSDEKNDPEMNMRNLKRAIEELLESNGIPLDTR